MITSIRAHCPKTSASPLPRLRILRTAALAAALVSPLTVARAQDNWVSVPNADTKPLNNVTFAGGRFVAVGNAHAATIGLDDTVRVITRPGAFGGALHGIDTDGSTYVLAGSSGPAQGASRIFTSPDMHSPWSRNYSSLFDDLRDVLWTGERFVAVGHKSAWTSDDAGNWFKHNTPANNSLQAVTQGEGRLVAVGQGGTVIHSEDGATWFAGTAATQLPGLLQGVAHGNSTFVAVGKETNYVPALATSNDGVTWHGLRLNLPVYTELRAVAYGAGTFVAVGANGLIVTSTDGRNWTRVPSPTSRNLNGIAYGNGRFLAVGQDGTILRSDAPDDAHGGLLIHRAIELEIPTRIGKTYQLRSSRDLRTWSDFGDPFEGTGESVHRLVSTRHGDHRYFGVAILVEGVASAAPTPLSPPPGL